METVTFEGCYLLDSDAKGAVFSAPHGVFLELDRTRGDVMPIHGPCTVTVRDIRPVHSGPTHVTYRGTFGGAS